MKRGPRQHQPIQQRHRHAHRNTFAQGPQHAACRRAVDVQPVARASISRRNHVRLARLSGIARHGEADVANDPFIQDSIHGLAVIHTALRQPPNLCASRRCKCKFAHTYSVGPRCRVHNIQNGRAPYDRAVQLHGALPPLIVPPSLRYNDPDFVMPMPDSDAVFTAETFRFFRQLARNNHKAWMDANRDRYRACIVEPFRALLDRLAPGIRKLDPTFNVSGRSGENFSRINRDIRFAADKAPYRPHFYLFFSRSGNKGRGAGQLYTGLSAGAVTVGFRIYFSGRQGILAQLAIPRARENARWLERQKRRLVQNYDSYWYTSEKGHWIKRDGWPVTPEEWKRLKGWIVRRKFPPAAATHADFPDEVAAVFRALYPLHQFTTSPDWKQR
jgi:uncharacterized protein (TIGR02453 family)